MDVGDFISLAVAAMAGLAALASQRSASRASTMNTQTTSRVDMEKDAYERARKFDVETIERQDAEIAELRLDNIAVHEQLATARAESRAARSDARSANAEVTRLRERVAVLEAQLT